MSYKILSNILCEKLNVYAEEIIGDYQCGFIVESDARQQIMLYHVANIRHKYSHMILARNKEALQNVFMLSVQATRPVGLNIYEEKANYMTRSFHDSHIRIGSYIFGLML